MLTPEDFGKTITEQLKAGEAAVAHAAEISQELIAVKAMLTARNAFIDERTSAHAADIESLKQRHADREAELQREIDRLRLAEQVARDDLGVQTGKLQALQGGLAGIVAPPTPRALRKVETAVSGELSKELAAAPDKPGEVIPLKAG